MSAQDYVFRPVLLSRVEFKFNTYLNGTSVVKALQNLKYKGGNTRTGAGLKFLADKFFNPASSREVPKVRPLVLSLHVKWHIWALEPFIQAFACLNLWMEEFWSMFRSWFLAFQITILITDGKSQDNVEDPAQKLRSQGVYIFAIGRCSFFYNSSLDRTNILPGYLLCLFRCKECRHIWVGSNRLPAQHRFHSFCWGV